MSRNVGLYFVGAWLALAYLHGGVAYAVLGLAFHAAVCCLLSKVVGHA